MILFSDTLLLCDIACCTSHLKSLPPVTDNSINRLDTSFTRLTHGYQSKSNN